MATNEILQFASQDTGSNLLTQAEYEGDAQRTIGHQPGIARSRLENKVLRQASLMAAGLAQFIVDNNNSSVTDSMSAQDIADALLTTIEAKGGGNAVTIEKRYPTYSQANPAVDGPITSVVEYALKQQDQNVLSIIVAAGQFKTDVSAPIFRVKIDGFSNKTGVVIANSSQQINGRQVT